MPALKSYDSMSVITFSHRNFPAATILLTMNMSTRRSFLRTTAAGSLTAGFQTAGAEDTALAPRAQVAITGVYGGYLSQIVARGEKPADYGINAVWVGSGGLKAAEIAQHRAMGLKVFAEFNSMHHAAFLREHPDAAPIGPDGKPSPAPNGWQGVSAHHAGYRRERMQEFRRVLETFEIDGIWLDYHHAHASWEQATPQLPDTDFCPQALVDFKRKTGLKLPAEVPAAARLLLGEQRQAWTDFRCAVFTEWVREYREILNATRPVALLGTFHCPWDENDHDGAMRQKLAIDLKAQAAHLDVFSIMPYHARFGHATDPVWVSRQTRQLGEHLGIRGTPGEKHRIWPIVQLADWGEAVPVEQVRAVIDHGTRLPATGVMAFRWGGFANDWPKVEAMGAAYRALRPGK